ncbi:MAG: response regulator [Candidatus Obscuribacterales bacterium]|nr:response regulator [Steroidobacteraceae bacterium]
MTQLQDSEIKGMTVLIADDDDAMRSVLDEVLRACELQVVGQARDGKEAVDRYRKLRPKIVCLDMEMPEMNGVEALTEIRSESDDVIILLITGSATSAVVKSAIAARVDGIIAKPFSAARVRAEITRCVIRAAQKK